MYCCMELNSLSWSLLTWYIEAKSAQNRDLNNHWHSNLPDSYFHFRWFSKHRPCPLSLCPITIFRHLLIDPSYRPFSWPRWSLPGIHLLFNSLHYSLWNHWLTSKFQKISEPSLQQLPNYLTLQLFSGTIQTLSCIYRSL